MRHPVERRGAFLSKNIDKSPNVCYNGTRIRKDPVGVAQTAAVASSYRGTRNLFPSSMFCMEGGGMMAYITWLDLIDIATLVIAIVSLVLSNKKR